MSRPLVMPGDGKAIDVKTGHFTTVFYRIVDALCKKANAANLVTEVTTADATDLATAITLVNSLKDKINEISAAART